MAERVLPPGRVQALAVTAAALFVYQFGSRLPLYGIDPKALSGLLSAGGLGLERLSLFTLGVIPLYSSLLLVELARLLELTGSVDEALAALVKAERRAA